ncbi:hypothetical protein BGZ95_002158 [Linnemannia exigua]|uniref:Uncharacterized protein n=1 Tax=Linnemannia exigua TaxID=604196 RepID=A0AAD4D6G5_9FUNG|nr:hypothetical protein BGZ95_002158 [Linnemannia exigua]
MTAENYHVTIDSGMVKTQDHSDPIHTNADIQLRAQTLPAHIKLHSTQHTHIHHHEVSANALAQKLKELKTSNQTAATTTKTTTDKNQGPEKQHQKQRPPLLLDRAALISIELQRRGEEALQDILERLESKKGALTEVIEAETVEPLPDSNEAMMTRRQHTSKINPELLKDNHPLQQRHGNANLRHH